LWFRPPLPVDDAFKYAYQLAKILQYIHQHGYLHGALTFANVLVLRGPNMEHEADYAPFLVADVGLTNFVRRFGNPQIEALPVSAAPEQLGKRVTPASDQFALAVLLYFWLSGRPPYLGEPDEIEQLKLTETITPLSTLNPGVTKAQDSIILRALMVYPEERHPSVLAFVETLLESLTSTPQARPASGNLLLEQPETPRELLVSSPALQQRTELAAKKKSNEQPPLASTATTSAEALLQALAHAAPTETLEAPPEQQPPSPEAATETSPVETGQAITLLVDIPETPELEHQEVALVELEMPQASPPETPGKVVVSTTPEASSGEEDLAESASTKLEAQPEEYSAPSVPEQPVASADETAIPTANITASDASMPDTEAEVAETSQAALDTRAPRLLISSPYSSNTAEFLLTREETSIGRAGASDLLLDYDNLTSRHHALLKRIGEHVLIFDKRSNNGVFINGQKIEVERGYELADGDHIGIGSYELIFRTDQFEHTSQLIS
ncbi:MAG TPA: FHA domain-containing protein, partial [Ktedonobacteraceae bacterium]|nr:FHA domain-containing protein [Ktedonobacteraceae bacterium]